MVKGTQQLIDRGNIHIAVPVEILHKDYSVPHLRVKGIELVEIVETNFFEVVFHNLYGSNKKTALFMAMGLQENGLQLYLHQL